MTRFGFSGSKALVIAFLVTCACIAVFTLGTKRPDTARMSSASEGRPIEILPRLSSGNNDDVDELLVLTRKLALSSRPTVGEALHYWRLCNIRAALLASKSGDEIAADQSGDFVTSAEIRRSILIESEYLKRFGSVNGDERLITPAEGGLTIADQDKKSGIDGQSHPGQLLFYLSECNIGLDDEVQLTEGTFRVGDILRRELLFFDKDVSAAKTAPAFARYLAPQRSFSTWNQVEFSFTDLMSSLIQDAPESGWCHGTHRCYAVAVLLHIDRSKHILSRLMQAQAAEYLVDIADRLSLSQHADGAWRYDWSAAGAMPGQPVAGSEWGDSVICTGHHLEWLFLQDDETLSSLDLSIERARRFLRHQLTALTSDELAKDLVAWCHAARSLLIWESRRPQRHKD